VTDFISKVFTHILTFNIQKLISANTNIQRQHECIISKSSCYFHHPDQIQISIAGGESQVVFETCAVAKDTLSQEHCNAGRNAQIFAICLLDLNLGLFNCPDWLRVERILSFRASKMMETDYPVQLRPKVYISAGKSPDFERSINPNSKAPSKTKVEWLFS
jgi:hypothetical protein